MSNNDPDQIRREIDRTRRDLSQNVDALSDQVRPGNVARRQQERMTEAVSDRFTAAKERVMGVADDVSDRFGGDDDTSPGLGDRAARLRDDAGHQAKRRTQGNPLAAGLIALGAGWLVGSLIPSSRREQEASSALKDRAQPLAENAQQWAKDTGEQLREPAEQAFEDLKESATSSAEKVKAEGQHAAEDVRSESTRAVEDVRAEGEQAAEDVTEEGRRAKDDVQAQRD